MVTTATGRLAETAVADWMAEYSYKIMDRNWHTPVCEIDIVASKDKVTYFVEVKYRLSTAQGSGLDYITPKKLNQMKYAARIWCQQNSWEGDYRLLGAEVSGLNYENINLVEIE